MRADPLQDYDLTQALILLGQRMYGDEWSGNHNELKRADWSLETPEQLKAKLDKLQGKVTEVETKVSQQKRIINGSVKQQVIDEAEAEIARLYDHRSYLNSKKNELPTFGDSYVESYNAYKRRIGAEQVLVDALAKKKIRFWTCGLTPDNNGPWIGKPGYKYSIELSLVRWHSRDAHARWQPVRVYRQSFDEWLKTVAPATAGAMAELPLETQGEYWLRDFVANPPDPRPSKEIIIGLMRDQVAGLGQRPALRIWDKVVPIEWKKSGRPSKKS